MNIWIIEKGLMILPDKEAFCSELYREEIIEEITDEDYILAQKVFKKLTIKNLGEYHDPYVQSDIFLLADVFQNLECNILKYMILILLI